MHELTEVKITDGTVSFTVQDAPRHLIPLRKGDDLHFEKPVRINDEVTLEGEWPVLRAEAFITPNGIRMEFTLLRPGVPEDFAD